MTLRRWPRLPNRPQSGRRWARLPGTLVAGLVRLTQVVGYGLWLLRTCPANGATSRIDDEIAEYLPLRRYRSTMTRAAEGTW